MRDSKSYFANVALLNLSPNLRISSSKSNEPVTATYVCTFPDDWCTHPFGTCDYSITCTSMLRVMHRVLSVNNSCCNILLCNSLTTYAFTFPVRLYSVTSERTLALAVSISSNDDVVVESDHSERRSGKSAIMMDSTFSFGRRYKR